MISYEEEMKNTDLIAKAIDFATKKHASVINSDGSIGQKRKGSSLPYIVHPLEVWTILRSNFCSVEVQTAGLLHDCLEDAGVTPDEIELVFGPAVAELVKSESEDKSRTWKERKQHTINALASDSVETMQLCCADKLSNCRAQLYDYKQIGEKLWERFNASKEDQSWYYHSIVNALKPIEGMKMYEELKDTVNQLYGE